MAELNCSLNVENEKALTVGDRFSFSCEGTDIPALDLAKAEIRLEEADKYKLKLFQVQKSPSGALLLDLTSYQVGEHTLKAVQLVDSENSVLLGDLKFTIESVQNPKEPVKEPFGPWGPIWFMPYLFLALVGTALVLFSLPFLFTWLKRRQRKKLMDILDSKSFQYAAFPELHRELRRLQREHLFLADSSAPGDEASYQKAFQEMQGHYLTYLSRHFRIPAFQWTANQVVRALLKDFELPEKTLGQVAVSLREVERARKDPTKLNSKDLNQLLKMMKQTSELLETGAKR